MKNTNSNEKEKRKSKKDNVIYVNGPKEAAENNSETLERVKKGKKRTYIFFLLFVLVCVACAYIMINKKYSGYRVISKHETNFENTANYIQFSGNLLKYTPDGVSYINTNGDIVWSAGIDMKMPIAVASGNYAVVADISGNSVCVYSNEGLVSNLTMPYPICDVDIANQGAFAVVLESEETNYINLYDKKGVIIYEMKTTIDKSGYPLDITISDDGIKLFTSYVNVGASVAENNLAAYNFGDVGQNSNADRMVGGYRFDGQIVPKVEFVENDTVIAFGTKTISIYAMKEKPSEKAKIELTKEVRSIFYTDKYFGIIQDVENEESKHMYEVKVYNLRGDLMFKDYLDFGYDTVYADKNEIIITGGSDCIIFRKNGSVKFEASMTGKIVSVVPSGRSLEYIVVYDNSTEVIKLKSKSSNVVE